jgi:hypothetical protein
MSGDPEPVEAEIIDIDTRQDSAGSTVVLAGEFDMTAARRRLSGARSPGPEASDETGKVRMTPLQNGLFWECPQRQML